MSSQPGRRQEPRDDALLELRDLQVAFRDPTTGRLVHAVNDASFAVPHRTFVGLTGESGSGKTTVALSLMGMSKGAPGILGGELKFEGRTVYDAGGLQALSPTDRAQRIDRAMAPLRGREIFMIFQEPRASLNPYWKIRAQLEECLRRNGASTAWTLETLLDAVWLPPSVLGMYPSELSTGMCQRIMIAMALAMNVKLLLADEPLSRIDLRLRRKVIAVLERIRARRQMAMLLSTHDLDLLKELADTVVVMYKGKVVEIGPAGGVLDPKHAPKHEYTALLLATYGLVESAAGSGGNAHGHKSAAGSGGALDGSAGGLDRSLAGRLRKRIVLGDGMTEAAPGHWIRR